MNGKFSIAHLSAWVIPIIVLIGLLSSDPIISFLIVAGIIFGLFPIIDALSGHEKSYPYDLICTQKNEPYDSPRNLNLITTYLIVFTQFAAICVGLYNITTEGVIWFPYFLLVGYSSANVLNVSHELYHTKRKFQTFVARIASLPMFWDYEEIHHLYVHHRDETTCLPGDGVIASRGQSLYSYVYQMITVGFKKSWAIQKDLLAKKQPESYEYP